MTSAENLTTNAYLKLRDNIAHTISTHGGVTLGEARSAAEGLIMKEYIDVKKVLELP